MEEIFERFPGLGKAILAHVDDKTLVLWRKVNKRWRDFNDNQKTFWIRMIEKEIGKSNTFSDDWKKVVFKTPVRMVKELAIDTHEICKKIWGKVF